MNFLPVPSTDGRLACDFTLYLQPASQASPSSSCSSNFLYLRTIQTAQPAKIAVASTASPQTAAISCHVQPFAQPYIQFQVMLSQSCYHTLCDRYLYSYLLCFVMSSQPRQGMVKISELQVNPEYKTLLPPLLDEEFENLEKSILEEKRVSTPFIINPDKVVLDGHHRLLICQRHSIDEVPFTERSFESGLEEKEFVISINLNRRHLTLTQRFELGMTIYKIEMVKAGRRQGTRTDLITNKEGVNNIPSNLKESEEEQGEAMEIAAKKVGLGTITFWKAKRIAEAAQIDKHAYTAWRDIADGNRSIDSVYQELFHQEEPPPSALPSRPPIPTPKVEGGFQVIVIDPPTFNLEKLKEVINPFDEKNCVLWLWTPFKSLPDAFSLLHHWRFQPQTMLTWVKNKRRSGKWLLNQTEYCILATRGKPSVNLTFQSTALIATSGKRNSKPDEFYFLVDSLCDGRKLDLFGKINRPGWESMKKGIDANDA